MEIQLQQYEPKKIFNSKGQEIILNAHELHHAAQVQAELNHKHGFMLKNSLGYEIPITTLTTIMKKVSEQKFFEVAPADFLPVRVGEGAWSTQLTTYRSFDIGGSFETGIVNTGGQNDKLASADAGVDALNIQVFNWAKTIGWTIMDLEQAAKSGNWDLVSAKEKSRKKNWDLGIQRIAFLGAQGANFAGGQCLGLLNQAGVNTNTTRITEKISGMTTAELKTFTAGVIEDYRSNCNRTAMPTHFIVPESDYNGMASTVSPDFPIKSILELLEGMFKTITRNNNFKILPLAYADAAYHSDIAAIAGKQVYVLLNYDEESLRMDIPVDYTNTLMNSINNFQFQNVGYGQFTGVLAYRPLEMLYFTYSA